MKVAALEEGLQRVTEAYAHNLSQIRRAFALTDSHIWCLQCISNHISRGELQTLELSNGLHINLPWYHNQYNQVMQFTMLIDWLYPDKMVVEPEEPEEPEEQDNTVVFGGNDGTST
jgi:hypothetical protein